MDKSIDNRFKKAIAIRDEGNLEEAISEFEDIIDLYFEHPKIGGVYTVLGGVYMDLKNNLRAKECFKQAITLKPSSELASLGLYLSYIEIENYNEAIKELKRYLDQYPADRYKITLKELLNDLEDGYAIDFKDTIIELATKHNVRLPF